MPFGLEPFGLEPFALHGCPPRRAYLGFSRVGEVTKEVEGHAGCGAMPSTACGPSIGCSSASGDAAVFVKAFRGLGLGLSERARSTEAPVASLPGDSAGGARPCALSPRLQEAVRLPLSIASCHAILTKGLEAQLRHVDRFFNEP